MTKRKIEIFESDSVEKAPEGSHLIEEQVLAKGGLQGVEGFGDSPERAVDDAKGLPKESIMTCLRCGRQIEVEMENGRYWCVFCGDWARSEEEARRQAEEARRQAEEARARGCAEEVEALLAIYDQNPDGFAPGYGDAKALANVKHIGKALNEAGGMDRMLEAHAEFARRTRVSGASRNLEHAWDRIGEWLG